MSKLIKAEWFRFSHSSMFRISIMFCILVAFLPLSMCTQLFSLKLGQGIVYYKETLAFVPIILGTMVSASTVGSYHSKTAYYEIMNGASISSIIISKLIVNGGFVFGLMTVLWGGQFVYIYAANGMGNLENPVMTFVTIWTVLLHTVVVSSLFSTAIRNAAAGAIPYARFGCIETIIMLVIVQLNGAQHTELADKICSWLLMGQAAESTFNSYFIFALFVSLVVDVALWYILTYVGYKKKKFK